MSFLNMVLPVLLIAAGGPDSATAPAGRDGGPGTDAHPPHASAIAVAAVRATHTIPAATCQLSHGKSIRRRALSAPVAQAGQYNRVERFENAPDRRLNSSIRREYFLDFP
ncbi:hypothetical protein AB7M35_002415 [Amorphus suaedae]